MNQQEMDAKIEEIVNDEEYLMELLKLETAEEVQASLKERGLELSIEEILEIKDIINRKDGDVLSDEDLEDVNGGMRGGNPRLVQALADMLEKIADWFAKW